MDGSFSFSGGVWMAWFIFWLAVMTLAALLVLPKIKKWKMQGSAVNVSYKDMWQKRVFRYSLPISVQEAVERLQNQLSCAGVAYAFDASLLQITLRSDLPDGTVPATFQRPFEGQEMIATRLSRTVNAGTIQLAMGEFWRIKLGASLIHCE